MKLLAEWNYTPSAARLGYTGETLYVGLGNCDGNYRFENRPVTDDMITSSSEAAVLDSSCCGTP